MRYLCVAAAVALFTVGVTTAGRPADFCVKHPANPNCVTTSTTTTSTSELFFDGGFDTGDLSQWPSISDANGASVQTQTTFNSPYAMRCDVDDVPDTSVWGDACMVERNYGDPWEQEGSDTWYRMQVYFSSNVIPQDSSGLHDFAEYHDAPCCPTSAASPMLAMEGWDVPVGGPPGFLLKWTGGSTASPTVEWERDVYGSGRDDFPSYQADHWYDMVWHVKWSQSAAVGFVEWWIEGRQVTPPPSGKDASGNSWPAHFPTLFRNPNDGTSNPVRFQVGVYRRTTPNIETVFVDGAKVGATRAAVGG